MGRNKETMKRVLKFISPYKAKIIIMLLTALVTVGFTLYTPIPVSYTHLDVYKRQKEASRN